MSVGVAVAACISSVNLAALAALATGFTLSPISSLRFSSSATSTDSPCAASKLDTLVSTLPNLSLSDCAAVIIASESLVKLSSSAVVLPATLSIVFSAFLRSLLSTVEGVVTLRSSDAEMAVVLAFASSTVPFSLPSAFTLPTPPAPMPKSALVAGSSGSRPVTVTFPPTGTAGAFIRSIVSFLISGTVPPGAKFIRIIPPCIIFTAC